MQLPLTLPQSMLGPRIEHQLLGLVGPLVNLPRTARGEAGVREAVDAQQGPRRDIDGALGPVGLGGERDHGDDLVGEGTCGDDHRAAAGVPTRTTREQPRPFRNASPVRTSSTDSTYTPGWR